MPPFPQCLVIVCGWPVSGKTTIARRVQTVLDFHRVDIDDVRRVATGLPHPHPNMSEELRRRDVEEMAAAYALLLSIAEWHLEHGRSLIVTATFSRLSGQHDLQAVINRHPDVLVRIIWCRPENDTREEIEHRLSRPFGDGGYVGGVNSYDRYLEVKQRFQPIELPHLRIDTGPSETVDQSVERALRYIRSVE
jgi:predicted kinase